jgi:spermidine synthase
MWLGVRKHCVLLIIVVLFAIAYSNPYERHTGIIEGYRKSDDKVQLDMIKKLSELGRSAGANVVGDADHTEFNDMGNLNKLVGEYDTVHNSESKYQKIDVLDFKKNKYGMDRCLFLNSEPQLCNNDEKYYHELIVHLPAAYIIKLNTVLIIGGGDCMTLREVMKYKSIETVYMLELDQKVIDVSKKYFNVSDYADDDRVNIIVGDAIKNIKDMPKKFFDLIIIDTTEDSDNNSPIDDIAFFKKCKERLKPDGILVKNGDDYSNNISLSKLFKHNNTFKTERFTYLGEYFFTAVSDNYDFDAVKIRNKETKNLYNTKQISKYNYRKHDTYLI